MLSIDVKFLRARYFLNLIFCCELDLSFQPPFLDGSAGKARLSFINFFQPLFFYLCKGGRQGVEDKVFTEEDWAADEGVSPYEKSKKRAEKAAWELVEKLPGYNLLTFLKKAFIISKKLSHAISGESGPSYHGLSLIDLKCI